MRNLTSLSLAFVFAGFIGCSGPNETTHASENPPETMREVAKDTLEQGTKQAENVVAEETEKAATQIADKKAEVEALAEGPGGWSAGDTIPSGMAGVPDIQILAVHNNGSGDVCGLGKMATLKYKAMLANGKVIDPGTRPFSFKVGAGRAIKGWDVVVSKMRVGDSFTIMLPMKLAYGPSKGDLKFDMELLSVK